VRDRVLSGLGGLDLSDGGPLLAESFVFRMVLQHEYQHNETILQTLQLKQGDPYPTRRPDATRVRTAGPPPGSMVRMPGGAVRIGTDDRSEAYDNERPSHVVDLPPFWIDVHPTTNGEYMAFMADGGYENRDFWTDAGWAWRCQEGIECPGYWFRDEGRWKVRSMDRIDDVDRSHPVCHVCFHEADAFARWAGKRLPTEFEWEAAATWNPDTGTKTRFPWGDGAATSARANVGAVQFGTDPIGSRPENVSPIGCHGMIGDIWEWTSSDFRGYPGFEAFPYPEYSEVFFGDESKVLRGGSWASRGCVSRATFRNWDYPIRRQIFSGFRCARDDP
jgi:iron(II)-dependent oxidoreductase